MHTILGSNGIIGQELAKVLRTDYTEDIRLVSRNPRKVHPADTLMKGNLLYRDQVQDVLENTSIAYLTVGLPYRSDVWIRNWPIILRNVVDACRANGCKLVYFDNTYLYPQDSLIQKEDTPLNPDGKKGQARKIAAEIVLDAIAKKHIEASIVRAPEFYGPGKTIGITNALVFENLKKGKRPMIFLRDDVKRTLIYTPDAGRAMAMIANKTDTYSQTWHLPCDDQRLTFEQFIREISNQLDREVKYRVIGKPLARIFGFFNRNVRETLELLPRYAIDNIFDSSKFKSRFPEFKITTYQQGIKNIIEDYGIE
ncbi:MAG: NAD-dependent epimerase/dehydratase family protein [Saprospiraceae bacterium]|nr:NAD-dependent epimerase/dehydratase family protein [Saprospiraceae bacterium]